MSIYDEVEIEDLEFEADEQMFFFPCPCGDRFQVSLFELTQGEDIATCPSCSLRLKIVFETEDLDPHKDEVAAMGQEVRAC
eukprot:CAMPEP_0115020768 /NCGR_PEP_ID=MMETSP0216-20121206/30399_1 /TAXON_ID=223996 /ORGANISM="Protocruzia adherens, Strain Boccale" /LENGTH=80 /DNA_ID=CAMNT_0002392819 /DNA_START=181 /DNA_END=423 /DNA_ORIENTATION=-